MDKENDAIKPNNLGTFYNLVNKRLKHTSVIGALCDECGNTVAKDDDKANLFNEYFGFVGVVVNNLTPVCSSILNDDCVLETVEFNARNVLAAMSKHTCNLSSGPDPYPYPYIRLIIQLTHRNMITKIKQMIKKKNDKKIEVQQQSQYESLYNILTINKELLM